MFTKITSFLLMLKELKVQVSDTRMLLLQSTAGNMIVPAVKGNIHSIKVNKEVTP